MLIECGIKKLQENLHRESILDDKNFKQQISQDDEYMDKKNHTNQSFIIDSNEHSISFNANISTIENCFSYKEDTNQILTYSDVQEVSKIIQEIHTNSNQDLFNNKNIEQITYIFFEKMYKYLNINDIIHNKIFQHIANQSIYQIIQNCEIYQISIQKLLDLDFSKYSIQITNIIQYISQYIDIKKNKIIENLNNIAQNYNSFDISFYIFFHNTIENNFKKIKKIKQIFKILNENQLKKASIEIEIKNYKYNIYNKLQNIDYQFNIFKQVDEQRLQCLFSIIQQFCQMFNMYINYIQQTINNTKYNIENIQPIYKNKILRNKKFGQTVLQITCNELQNTIIKKNTQKTKTQY